MNILSSLRSAVTARMDDWSKPTPAKYELKRDHGGLPEADPGIQESTSAAANWLLSAQSKSTTQDGGVARHYSLIDGWGPSYPETTGYILPTMIAWGRKEEKEKFLDAARTMADWLVSIQFADGGFQGGVIGMKPLVPVTFNTGQILLGLASASEMWGEPYRMRMNRAATWLSESQDPDGCWRRYPTPFAKPGEKAYETHVAWGLFEAARLEPNVGYQEKALKNVRWALGLQRSNGWIDKCCLNNPDQPLTHTLGYFLRGVIEAYRFAREPRLLRASQITARGLMTAVSDNGFLPGRVDQHFQGTVSWACLTGSVQIAYCLLWLFRETGDELYWEKGTELNRFVRRCVRIDGPEETQGGVKGAFPINGGYGSYEYLNWAPKFFIDANLLEAEILEDRRLN